MINEVICIGSSHTQGGGLHPKRNADIVEYLSNKYGYPISDETHSWPAVIKTKTGINTRNLGKCGTGIEYIIRNVEDIIESEDCSDKLFVFDVSNWGRSELYYPKREQYIVANWGHRNGENPDNGFESYITPDYNKEYPDTIEVDWDFSQHCKAFNKYLNLFHDEHKWLIKQERDLLNLCYKLNAMGIGFRIFLAEPMYWKGMDEHKIITDNIIQLHRRRDGEASHMWDYLDDHRISIRWDTDDKFDDGHASIKGHEVVADLVIENLTNTNIL